VQQAGAAEQDAQVVPGGEDRLTRVGVDLVEGRGLQDRRPRPADTHGSHLLIDRAQSRNGAELLILFGEGRHRAAERLQITPDALDLGGQQPVLLEEPISPQVLALLDEESDGEGAGKEREHRDDANDAPHEALGDGDGADPRVVVRDDHQRPLGSCHGELWGFRVHEGRRWRRNDTGNTDLTGAKGDYARGGPPALSTFAGERRQSPGGETTAVPR
jgi:hypothetical protein